MAHNKEAQQAMAKALVPLIVIEFLCVVAGLVAWTVTDQRLWLLLAFAGTIPMVLFLAKNAGKSGKR